ncbi:lipopolysaccharide biosynthesis protein [Enterococcus sp. AZ140]|uniref:lipopolysaccharide biosynthesis protein n=1 Tax=Enterococcus sp. AZ140 TaxID=2774731 RepID=UPI003F1FDFF2
MLSNFYKNFKYVFSSQIFILLFGLARAFILPMLLNIEDYGLFQIYLFYTSYLGFFSLGYNEGIYLRFGEYSIENLPKRKIRNGNFIHFFMLLSFTLTSLLLVLFYIKDQNMRFIFSLVSCNILVLGLNGVTIYIYQITNQLKKYSFFNLLPKIVFVITIAIGYFQEIHDYKYYVIFDFISTFIVVVMMIIDLKEIYLFRKIESIKLGVDEFFKNIKSGINIMLALFTSMWMIGIGRFILERFSSIEEYSKYSLGITISNMLIILASALSTILYPTLKRIEDKNYSRIYEKLSIITFFALFCIPFFYFLAYLFIILFLKDYSLVLKYLILLFGVIGMQSRMQILNNTYYKILRKEKNLLVANVNSIILIGLFSLQFYFVSVQAVNIALMTFLVSWIRCLFSEIYLLSEMKMPNRNNLFQLITFLIIIIIIWLIPLPYSLGIYVIVFTLVCTKFFNNIKILIKGGK